VDDLFGLFPDLPWLPKRRADARLREVRARAEAARQRMLQTIAGTQRTIERQRQAFFLKRGLLVRRVLWRRRGKVIG